MSQDDTDNNKVMSAYSYKDDDIVILGYPRNEEESHCLPYYDWIISLGCRFDISFVFILILQNINFGLFWTLVALVAQDLYKAYLYQEPADMAMYSSLMALPWSFKVLYGLITDNVPILGLKRRPYLILFGLLQGAFMVAVYLYDGDDALVVALLLMGASLCIAFSNVVIDAVLII